MGTKVSWSLVHVFQVSVSCLSIFRTPCKINPAVNTVLSALKPCREETPLKRLQEHHQQQKEAESGKLQEQSMYCKELLLSGATEFCFEELRAERHFKKMAQESQEVRGQKDQASASNWDMKQTVLFMTCYLHFDNILSVCIM